ncbi:Phosphatidylinositol transfer protein beta isoform [Takifugu flavidus]|uniref:Phosphatidylinositol transfer protein beta isoform n=1 Tax=Takifugu flavidus TaxID=433684 RepID=A0A5C6NRB1_9TELE|nr:Phosphatidylinositol transfer protein beta isoform [Takifugu flavidus]
MDLSPVPCRLSSRPTKSRGRVSSSGSVAEGSKKETGGGEGIESKVPAFVKLIAPEGSLAFHEKAWNAYPYCRTIVTNGYMKDDIVIKIETWHKPDMGALENVHQLDEETLKDVEVVSLDIANKDEEAPGDYKAEEDPALLQSTKTGRGPLSPEWKDELRSECPQMCTYKLVTVQFHWWGLQTKVENFIHKQEKRIFTNFQCQLFCWMDRWVGLSIEDIRQMEDETQKELEELRNKGPVRGTTAAHEQ